MSEKKMREELAKELRRDFARQGGLARAKSLTPKERSKAATKAIKTRWARQRAARDPEATA